MENNVSNEMVGIAITVIGFIGTAFNVWLTARIRADIAELKVWSMNTFVAKADMPTHLAPYQAWLNVVQSRESENRLRTQT